MRKEKLEKWLNKRGFALVPSRKDEIDYSEKVVYYNKRLGEENQLHSILHECGHFVLQSSCDYDSRYKIQTEAMLDGRKRRSLQWRISWLREEYSAWEEGKALARKLGVEVDESKYDKYAAKCLCSYCEWVVNPKKFDEVYS